MEYSKKVKSRVRILLLASSLAVALVFGLSFYFSLVSAESALASKVPELSELAGKFKSTLMINTIIFAAIIVASFIALGSLITSRMFKPLAAVEEGLRAISSGVIPQPPAGSGGDSFESLRDSYISALSRIEGKEKSEISALEECVTRIGEGIDVVEKLHGLIDDKKRFSGIRAVPESNDEEKGSADDSVFMQPV